MTQDLPDPNTEIARLTRRLERERATRVEAEAIAEKGLRDLYDRQRQLELLEHIAAASNQMNSVREVLQLAIEKFCIFCDWSLGHAYVKVNGVLRSADAWHVADPARTGIFRVVTSAYEFAPGVGLPGMALETGEPVWISELSGDINFPRLRFAERCGLKCGVAFPVLSGKEVVAVVEFFATEPRALDNALLDLMAQAGNQLGRAIERQYAQERLEAQTVELAAARDKARAADKAKSAFLANMSHELRTPLNAIIGFSDLMIQGIYGPLTEKYAEYMQDIRASGVHLKDILNDILDLAKIDAGGVELRTEIVSLAEMSEACRRIIAPLAERAGVTLILEVGNDLPAFRLDPTRFKQTLINIVSNAVKFTSVGGYVKVCAALNSTECIVSVIDTGIGMTADGIALALLPFRQVDSALNRRFEGTGLGLPLSRALMELHGGELSIESEIEKGTTVRLHLPLSLQSQALLGRSERPEGHGIT
jgi:signal transduction histidine kinase